MDAQKIKSWFKDLFRQYAPTSVREGTLVVDNIIDPLTLLLTPIYDAVDEIANGSTAPSDATPGDLLATIGERLLAPPLSSEKSRSTIRIVVEEPARIDVAKGAQVATLSGVTYEVERTYSFAASQFSATTKWDSAAYVSPEISVVAVKAGSGSVVGAETLIVPAFSVPGLIAVYNPAASTNVAAVESESAYRERLKNAISSRAFDTHSGLLFALPEQFGSDVNDLLVIGRNDPEMTRDATFIRRVIASSPLDVIIDLTRTGLAGSMVTSNVGLTVNGLLQSQAPSNDYVVIAYDESEAAFASFATVTAANLVSTIKAIAFGHYVLLFAKEGADTASVTDWSLIQDLLSLVLLPSDDAAKDYVAFARKGDHNFVAKERFFDPEGGTEAFSFNTTIYEHGIDPNEPGRVIGFGSKIKGTQAPNPHLLYRRTIREKTGNLSQRADEISQQEYNLISRPDFRSVQVVTDLIFKDDFDRDQDISTALGKDWICGNTGEKWEVKDTAAGVFVYKDQLVLGPATLDPEAIDPGSGLAALASPVLVGSHGTSDTARSKAVEVQTKMLEAGVDPEVVSDVLRAFLEARSSYASGYRNIEGNTSPVVQREVPNLYGFRLTGTFRTTDDKGNPAAITMARNGSSAQKFRWYEGYGVAFNVSGDGAPNVFVVDNSSAERDMTVVGEELVNGKLNFNVLAQTFATILPDVTYEYEIIFGSPAIGAEDAIPLTARIWQQGQARPASPTISYGAYVPINRRDELLYIEGDDIVSMQPNAIVADHVGIGVSRTDAQYYWIFDDFKVQNVDPVFAQALFDFDVRGLEGNLDLRVVARGAGNSGGVEAFGHEIYVYDVESDSWDLLEDLTYGGFTYWTSQLIIPLLSHVERGRLKLLVTSKYPHEGSDPTPVESLLSVDYVFGSSYNRKAFGGGKADVYFVQSADVAHRPSAEITHTITAASELNYLTPEILGGPVEEVVEVFVGSGVDKVVLDSDEHRYFYEDEMLRGSMRERFVLALDPAFSGLNVGITARVHSLVPNVDTFLASTDKRKADSDVLARHKQSVFVDVTAEVTGSFSQSISDLLAEWINGYAGEALRESDIIDFLVSVGADSVTTEGAGAITLTERRLSVHGNMNEKTGATLKRSRIEHFVPGQLSITVL